MTVSFTVSKADMDLVGKIVERAATAEPNIDRLRLRMDLCATHANGNPMDFSKLLTADDFNFWHDVFGIQRHMNRGTGQLEDFFSPRCSMPAEAAR